MRPKSPCYILTFRSTADAIRFETWCGSSQLPGRLIPLPREISAGCGLAWKLTKDQAPSDWREAILNSGIIPEAVVEMQA